MPHVLRKKDSDRISHMFQMETQEELIITMNIILQRRTGVLGIESICL
jgi:hypothetical protein